MKKHLKSLFIAVVSVCVACIVTEVLAAPAAVTQSTTEVNKNLPPYNFKEKINDAVSDMTKIDLPTIILNLNEVVTNSPFATNITISIVNTYGYSTTNMVFGGVTQAVQVIGSVTSTATITPQLNH